ncbi:hypothetical protein Moror_12125 [Moniliophthora roreri MCA 2997]|uniref:Uncharacterized protein n=1 Tax=Moniliophthora roreri (strain MCA 2997) TaxID=1381753 RepID=V2WIA3_MONRO|nr:hypothetical protein Moror_12125 [Moniliophthora roreri MCA 2997]
MATTVHTFDFWAALQRCIAIEKICLAQGISLNEMPLAHIFEQWFKLPTAAPKESTEEWLAQQKHYAKEFDDEQRHSSPQTNAEVLEVGMDRYWVKTQALYFGIRCKQPHFVLVPIYPQVHDPSTSTIDHVAIGHWVPETDQCAVIQPNAYLADEDLNTLAVKTWVGGHKVLGAVLVLKESLDTPGVIDVMDGDIPVIMESLGLILLKRQGGAPFPPILGLNPGFPITPASGLLPRSD